MAEQAQLIEKFSKLIAESHTSLAATLRSSNVPILKAEKFCGRSKPAEDFCTWHHNVESHCDQLGITTEEKKANVLKRHLTGDALDEIRCLLAESQSNFDKSVNVLRSRFADQETVSSLSSAFYSRIQMEGEDLATFSRAPNFIILPN